MFYTVYYVLFVQHYEDKYAELLLRPILTSLADPNTTVRKAALDALYNCIKVMQVRMLILLSTLFYFFLIGQFGIRAHFTELITALSNHAMELDQDILMAVEMCDRVLKDLVTTDVSIEPEKFVVAIRERLTVDNAFARQFHLGWIVCALDMKYTLMARFLPDLLDGILVCLCDKNTEIQMQ